MSVRIWRAPAPRHPYVSGRGDAPHEPSPSRRIPRPAPGFSALPNAWDAASARLTQELGAKAIATSSAAVAWAHGFADGNRFPIAKLVTVIEEIAKSVSVPISTDAEAGYSDDLKQVAENVTALINAGAVGINLEDGAAPHDLHVRKIEAVREAAVRAGVDLYINARTDVYLQQLVPAEQAVEEALRRAAGIKNAGASGLFTPAIVAESDIAAIAERCGTPLNVMACSRLPRRGEAQSARRQTLERRHLDFRHRDGRRARCDR